MKAMKILTLIALSSVTYLIAPSFECFPPYLSLRWIVSSDSSFLRSASRANLAEIEAGKIAVQSSKTQAIKKIAEMMIADHTTAQNELIALANRQNVKVPRSPDPEHDTINAHLSNLSGDAFDSAYLKSQLIDHKAAIALFEKESLDGADDAVRAYATKYLPKLKNHLSMIKMHNGMAADTKMSD